jgi:hypothetical protein
VEESDLMESIKTFNNIIVYGAQKKGRATIWRIKANIQGAAIFSAVSAVGDEKYCSNVLIQDIHKLKHLRDTSIVLIAASLKYHDEMEKEAREIGFGNVIRISEPAIRDMEFRHGIFLELADSKLLQYRIINETRLNHLRVKVMHGQSVKVMFIATSPSKFSYASIYRKMSQNPIFKVSIFIFDEIYYSRKYIQGKTNYEKELRASRTFAEKLKCSGYNVASSE